MQCTIIRRGEYEIKKRDAQSEVAKRYAGQRGVVVLRGCGVRACARARARSRARERARLRWVGWGGMGSIIEGLAVAHLLDSILHAAHVAVLGRSPSVAANEESEQVS